MCSHDTTTVPTQPFGYLSAWPGCEEGSVGFGSDHRCWMPARSTNMGLHPLITFRQTTTQLHTVLRPYMLRIVLCTFCTPYKYRIQCEVWLAMRKSAACHAFSLSCQPMQPTRQSLPCAEYNTYGAQHGVQYSPSLINPKVGFCAICNVIDGLHNSTVPSLLVERGDRRAALHVVG